MNAVALHNDAQGAIQFILRSQDLLAKPKQQADLIIGLIMEVEYLPKGQKGNCAQRLHEVCIGQAFMLWRGLWLHKSRAVK